MKKSIFPFVLLLLILSSGCRKEVKEPTVKDPFWYYPGTLTGLRNGKAKTLRVLAVFDTSEVRKTINVSLLDYHNDFQWDGIGVYNLPLRENTYLLNDYRLTKDTLDSTTKYSPAAYYNGSFNHGADHIAFNSLALDRPHYIKIDSYDPATKTIKGSASFTFRILESWDPEGRKDSVSYTEATFETKIYTQEETTKMHNFGL